MGEAAAIVEDDDGGQVFVHGNLVYAWDVGDTAGRRLAAVSLIRIKAATQLQVAEAFAVQPATVRRWETQLADMGVAGLLPETKGPKRKSKLTANVVAKIQRLRQDGASYRAIIAATGVSHGSVRNALAPADVGGDEPCAPTGSGTPPSQEQDQEADSQDSQTGRGPEARNEEGAQDRSAVAVPAAMAAGLPVLAGPPDRSGERVLARFGMIPAAPPVFTGCAHARWRVCSWRRRRWSRPV